jgi:carboxypeptidase D
LSGVCVSDTCMPPQIQLMLSAVNGGPGCSSMEGLMTENGPINWLPGTDAPTPNPFTWLNLTHVVWIDQPLGVGYSQGEPDVETEEELAVQFTGFWKKFVKLFCMEEWRMYLTGESYAGVYIPYIAGAVRSTDCQVYVAYCADLLLGSSSVPETQRTTIW